MSPINLNVGACVVLDALDLTPWKLHCTSHLAALT